jgi:cytochrome oxidase Cu insertion factor (SCO1/SenC/PrrC family)
VAPGAARSWQRSPRWWLCAALVALVVFALALGIAARATAGAQTLDALVGRPAPAFSLAAEIGGKPLRSPVSLASQRGHPTLVVFFYTLCTHCLGELQTVASVASAHAADRSASGPVPLYINSPAEPGGIPDAYLARAGIDAPVLLDRDGAVAAAYGIRYYPALVLIDANGVVRATWTGEVSAGTLDDAIKRMAG